MKKTFKSILLVLLGVFAFTCCEDVPAPYEIPDKKEKKTDQEILPTGDGTLENPYNVAGVLKFISTLQPDVESDKPVYVKGKVLNNSTDEATITQHGNMNFTMIDEGNSSNTFLAWQVMAPGNQRFTSVNDIKTGDEVIVYGKVINYKGNTPETVNRGQAYVYSINGKGSGGGEDTQTSTVVPDLMYPHLPKPKSCWLTPPMRPTQPTHCPFSYLLAMLQMLQNSMHIPSS